MPAVPTTPTVPAEKRSSLALRPRTTAAGLGGAIATITIVALEANGVTVTAELAAAIATAASVVFAWSPSEG